MTLIMDKNRLRSHWESALRRGLEEDGWEWDWTTLGTIQSPAQRLKAQIIGKSDGIWAADGLVSALRATAPEIRVESSVEDGRKISSGQPLLEWEGPAREVLALERPFLNLAAYVGGIATRTAGLVEIVRHACPGRPPRVTSTRKILPGYRDLAIYGVRAGGGHSHRVSLSGGVLIKENHIAAAGGVSRAVAGARSVAPHGLKIEIEVRDEGELEQALQAGADAVLLDNFSSEQVRAALALIDRYVARGSGRPGVEVSGGLNEANIASYAIEGVDILSLGSLTHSVKAIDLSLLVR